MFICRKSLVKASYCSCARRSSSNFFFAIVQRGYYELYLLLSSCAIKAISKGTDAVLYLRYYSNFFFAYVQYSNYQTLWLLICIRVFIEKLLIGSFSLIKLQTCWCAIERLSIQLIALCNLNIWSPYSMSVSLYELYWFLMCSFWNIEFLGCCYAMTIILNEDVAYVHYPDYQIPSLFICNIRVVKLPPLLVCRSSYINGNCCLCAVLNLLRVIIAYMRYTEQCTTLLMTIVTCVRDNIYQLSQMQVDLY